MQLQDFARLLRVVFAKYAELQGCNSAPVLEVGAAISRVGLHAAMKKPSILASSCETTRSQSGLVQVANPSY